MVHLDLYSKFSKEAILIHCPAPFARGLQRTLMVAIVDYSNKTKGNAGRKSIILSVCPRPFLSLPILCVFILRVPQFQLSTEAVNLGSALLSALLGL